MTFAELLDLADEVSKDSRTGEEALESWSPYSKTQTRLALAALENVESESAKRLCGALRGLLARFEAGVQNRV